jgi:hypothetical protein
LSNFVLTDQTESGGVRVDDIVPAIGAAIDDVDQTPCHFLSP